MSIKANAAFIFLCAILNSNCSQKHATNKDHESGLKQLVEKDFVCDLNKKRLERVKSEITWILKGGDKKQHDDAWKVMSRLPLEYRQWVFDHNLLKVELRKSSGGVRGATTNSNNGTGWRPVGMWIAQKTGNFDPFMHEIGHAMQGYAEKTHSKMAEDLKILFNWIEKGGEANFMRGYAKTTTAEFFAEIFDSYYCSAESRKYMKEKMPRTHFFAQRYLINPSRLDSSSNTSIEGKKSLVDSDNDTVSDAFDKCPDTPVKDGRLFVRVKNYGCSESQVSMGDQDHDGVRDPVDLCPNTPKGKNVWKETTGINSQWLGCTVGQSVIR